MVSSLPGVLISASRPQRGESHHRVPAIPNYHLGELDIRTSRVIQTRKGKIYGDDAARWLAENDPKHGSRSRRAA